MKTHIILLLLIFSMSCSSQDCETLPKSYNVYSKAINTVENASFEYTDEVDTSKSSWIREANYYSCDKTTGYLIIETDSQNYIYQEVPISVWREFKEATSFGRYYNSYIKGNFKLNLNN